MERREDDLFPMFVDIPFSLKLSYTFGHLQMQMQMQVLESLKNGKKCLITDDITTSDGCRIARTLSYKIDILQFE